MSTRRIPMYPRPAYLDTFPRVEEYLIKLHKALEEDATSRKADFALTADADHNHDSSYISVISSPVTNNVPLMTAGGELATSTYGATSFIPSGLIAMWHGLIANIPSGWFLCDGTNGTPDLRSKFVKGSAAGVEAGSTGGAATHDHDSLTHTGTAVASHGTLSHSGTSVGDHSAMSHSGTGVSNHTTPTTGVASGSAKQVVTSVSVHSVTQPSSHAAMSHSVTQPTSHGTLTHSVTQPSDHIISTESNEPAYYSVLFIMKS